MSWDDWDVRQTTYLGGQISKRKEHKLFKILAKLGPAEAETEAFLDWLEWMANNPKADLMTLMRKLNEKIGMAHMLKYSKELTRLSMILGDMSKMEDYQPPKGKRSIE